MSYSRTPLCDTDSQISNYARPILFLLDGLLVEEHDEIRRIVANFGGRVRAIISGDLTLRPGLRVHTRDASRNKASQVSH